MATDRGKVAIPIGLQKDKAMSVFTGLAHNVICVQRNKAFAPAATWTRGNKTCLVVWLHAVRPDIGHVLLSL